MAMSVSRFGMLLGGMILLAGAVGCDNGTSADVTTTFAEQFQAFVGDFLQQLVAAWLL